MRLFGTLYARVLVWARDRRAVYYLSGLSFVEAFIFPIMPEVMLAPMMLGKRHRAFFYANLSLLFSLLGSLVGYALGHWAFHALTPMLQSLHLYDSIERGVESLRAQMNQHWLELMLVLMLAALQPVVPMKFVTWASGIVGVPVMPFLVCILLGRGKRVWVLALLIRLFGERAERVLHKHIEWIGWAALLALAALAAWWAIKH
ncbi:YqaA family protein [Dyella flagellata]|uniref:Membrane protein n=1 Tax=Dyella flagellata TaxID=1867833 RepID=A0ABQ5XGG8_9GAMM|nr:VTT domain-containing protein [Dyella flagellata]GLQ89638.1 membrane protein [Dyella flagellata]